jgi:hypothetical protein
MGYVPAIGVHRYPVWSRMGNALGVGLLAIVWLLLVGDILRDVPVAMRTAGPMILDIVNSLLFLGAVTIALAFALNLDPAFTIKADGIVLSCFALFPMFIPWKSVIGVKETILPFPGLRCVCFRGFSPTHAFFGLLLGGSLTPCFMVKSTIEGYDEALRHIRENATGDPNRDQG